MGRSVTVFNGTLNTIKLTYHFVGHTDNSTTINIDSSKEIKIDFKRKEGSETLILSIDDKAFRAVKINQIIRVLEIEKGLIIMDIDSRVSTLRYFTQKYKERVERDLYWNFVGFNEKYRKHANKKINIRNDLTETFGQIVTSVVEKAVNIKTDAIKYLKGKEIEERTKTDPNLLENIKRIKYQLIEISRAIEIYYPYLKEENHIDKAKSFDFLHDKFMKMTKVDILIFLENCGVIEAIPEYIFAVNLAFKIFDEIQLINENKTTTLKQNYIQLFTNQLESMWNKIKNDITNNISVQKEGYIYKSAEIRYQDQLIYKVKSFKKHRITDKIDDIKKVFIKNGEYQVDYLCKHPDQWIDKWKKLTV